MVSELLNALATVFARHQLPYMLIGGQAVLIYGAARLTEDVDITLGVAPDEIGRVLPAVAELGWRVLVADAPAFVRQTLVLPCEEPNLGIRIDLIFSFSAYERQAIERAKMRPIAGAELPVASLEDVLIHKMVAGRPRDLEDVRRLLLKNPDFDRRYVMDWLRQFEELLDKALTAQFAALHE